MSAPTTTSAYVDAQSSFAADDFGAITSRLNRQRLPGVSGVAFVVSATDGQVPAVQAHWRDRGVAVIGIARWGLRVTAYRTLLTIRLVRV